MAEIDVNGVIVLIDDEDLPLIEGRNVYVNNVRKSLYPCGRYTYALVSVFDGGKKKYALMHRFILNLSDRRLVVDHKNHNTLDNRKSNLRVCSMAENQQNKKVSDGKDLPLGVYFEKKNGSYWFDIVAFGKCHKRFGFSSPEEASAARKILAEELHGQFAYHLSVSVR